MNAFRYVAVGIAAVSIAACSVRSEARDAGPAEDRNFAIGAFNKIEVAGPFDVAVTASGSPGVSAHGGKALLDELEVTVDGGILRIGPKDRHVHISWTGHRTVTIAVSGATKLNGASLVGSGNLTLDSAAADDFKGQVAGSGNLSIARLRTGRADLSMTGSGAIKAAGNASSLHFENIGSGDINAAALTAADAKVVSAGSGNIRARATRTADVQILGSGDVTISGGAKCSVSKNGSGSASCS